MNVVRDKQSTVGQSLPEFGELPKHVTVAVRAVVQKHVKRPGKLIAALYQILHIGVDRDETAPQFIGNENPMRASLVKFDAGTFVFVRPSSASALRMNAEDIPRYPPDSTVTVGRCHLTNP